MELEVNHRTKVFGMVVKNKGFTLIELLVAMAVFGMVVVAMSTTAVSVLKSQRKGFALQNIQENARYILESMSKEIRMSEIVTSTGNFTDLSITNVDGDGDGSRDDDVDYQFTSNKIRRRVNGKAWQDLSPASLELTGSFYVNKSSSPDRAKVTIVMKIKSAETKAEKQAEIYLQSTVSQRSY